METQLIVALLALALSIVINLRLLNDRKRWRTLAMSAAAELAKATMVLMAITNSKPQTKTEEGKGSIAEG